MEKDSHQGKLTVAQELNIKQKSTKAYWNIAKREIDLEKQAEKIMTYKDAFAKIKKATGIASIAEMVEEFVRSEDQNFALFNQINNLHREIETLEVANSKMRAQVEKFKSQGSSSEMNKNKIFMTLQGQIERADAKQNIYTDRYNEAVQIINLLKPNLLALFREAGCDQGSGAIGQSLLAQGPTDTNLLQFLGGCLFFLVLFFIDAKSNRISFTLGFALVHTPVGVGLLLLACHGNVGSTPSNTGLLWGLVLMLVFFSFLCCCFQE